MNHSPQELNEVSSIEHSQRVAKVFFAVAVAACVGAIGVALSLLFGPAQQVFHIAAGCAVGLALGLGGAAWMAHRGRVRTGVALAMCATVLSASVYGFLSGIGVHTVILGIYGLGVVMAGVIVSMRLALGLAALSALSLVGMYFAEQRGWLAGSERALLIPDHVRLFTHLLLLGLALMFTVMIARVVRATMQQTTSREKRFQALLGIAADWYWEQDAQFRFTYVSSIDGGAHSEAAKKFLGKTRWDTPEFERDEDQWAQHRADLEAHRPFRNFVMRRKGADGTIVYTSSSGEPVFDEKGRFTGYWGVGRHVTGEMLAQRQLEASEHRYRELFERSPTTFIVHRQGRILAANGAAVRLFGYETSAAMQGLEIISLVHADHREFSGARIERTHTLALGDALPDAELHMVRKDGSELFVSAHTVRIELPDGLATLSAFFDLTERKRAEAQLLHSQTMLAGLFDASPDFIAVSELESGRMVMVNAGFTRLTGWTAEEALGKTASELHLWSEDGLRQSFLSALRNKGVLRNVPGSMTTRDGTVLSILLGGAMFNVDGHAYLVSIVRDITAREQARLQHEAILETAPLGIAFTRERTFHLVNPKFEEMLGWPSGSLVGKPGSTVWIDEADYADIGSLIGPVLARGESIDIERRMKRRDGGTFWCRLRARAIDPTHPLKGGTIWIAEDVTERRLFEDKLAQAKEVAESANRAKSAFLANTSHEIRTPLNGLLGLARLALETRTTPLQREEYLRRILESAESLTGIISDILDLSKIEAGKLTLERVDFDLHELVTALHGAYRELCAEKGVTLDLQLAPDVPRYVRGDATRVRQIVSNYLSNALKFTAQGYIELEVAVAGADRVKFTVVDTGIGMENSVRERLFTPFMQADESTTRRYGGTGLGLSICRQLALLMDGEVGVDSAPGTGSTFWATLPLPAAALPVEDESAELPDDDALAGLRVLLVEDNPVNMLIAETMLTNWGAQVTPAVDGRQAIEVVEREAGAFDVVLMDVHMPVLSGHDATRELRKRWSKDDLPIIALTAAALMSEQEQSLALGMNDFIAKPFDSERLKSALLRWGVRKTATAR